MSAKKKSPVTQPEPQPAKPAKECRALEVGHRSCTCPDCNHNAKKK